VNIFTHVSMFIKALRKSLCAAEWSNDLRHLADRWKLLKQKISDTPTWRKSCLCQ